MKNRGTNLADGDPAGLPTSRSPQGGPRTSRRTFVPRRRARRSGNKHMTTHFTNLEYFFHWWTFVSQGGSHSSVKEVQSKQ